MTKIRLETPTVLANGILQTDNPIDGTLQTVKDQNGNSSELQIANNDTKVTGTLTVADTLTAEERINLEADSTATTQTTAVIQATDTNSGIAIVPNGTGAFTLQVPDGTATGGNARGQYAVDLQRVRTAANEVASGQYSFSVGSNNRVISNYGVAMGTLHYVNGYANIVGGNDNSTSGNVTTCFGEINTVNSSFSTISGGRSNTASTNSHATVVGGYQNSSTGQYSISGGYSNVASVQGAVALGYDNTASGQQSIAMGETNTASASRSCSIGGGSNIASAENAISLGGFYNRSNAQGSVTIGGSSNTADAVFSYALGIRSRTYLPTQIASARNYFNSIGDAQQSIITSQKQDTLTTGATTELFINGISELLIPNGNNRVWNVTIKYTAVVTNITGTATGVSVGDCKNEVLTIGFKKIGGISQNVGAINILSTNEDASMNSAVFGISAGPSQEMKLDFSAPIFIGGGSLTIRVVAKVELTEVAY